VLEVDGGGLESVPIAIHGVFHYSEASGIVAARNSNKKLIK